MAHTMLHPDVVHPEPAPYSHACLLSRDDFDHLLFVSGQVGLDVDGEHPGNADFESQFLQVFANVKAILEDAGGGLEHVVFLRSFLTDPGDIPTFSELRKRFYPEYFSNGEYPSSTLLVVNGLFRDDLRLEIDAIAAL